MISGISHIDVTTIEPIYGPTIEPIYGLSFMAYDRHITSKPLEQNQHQLLSRYTVPASICRFLSKWLQYSQSSPLSVSLSLCHPDGEGHILIRDVIGEYFRLEDFNLLVVVDPCTEHPFTLPFSPSLASLLFRFSDGNIGALSKFAASIDFTSCADSLKLRNLSVCQGVRLILPKDPCSALQFPNLCRLHIGTDHVDDLPGMLSACSNIAYLSVHARQLVPTSTLVHEPSITDSEAVRLAYLTSLRIASEDRSATLQLLRWLTCPSLLTLHVEVLENVAKRDNLQEHSLYDLRTFRRI